MSAKYDSVDIEPFHCTHPNIGFIFLLPQTASFKSQVSILHQASCNYSTKVPTINYLITRMSISTVALCSPRMCKPANRRTQLTN